MNIEDLLNAFLGGVDPKDQQTPVNPQQEKNPFLDILGEVIGMGGSASGGRQPSGNPGFGLDDIIGSIFGPGPEGTMSNPLVEPIAKLLSENIGLDLSLSRVIVSFLLAKLFAGKGSGSAMPQGGSGSGGSGGLDLDHLLDNMDASGAVNSKFLESTGLVDELVGQTGLDKDTAQKSLEQALGEIVGRSGLNRYRPQPSTPERDLKNLLDEW